MDAASEPCTLAIVSEKEMVRVATQAMVGAMPGYRVLFTCASHAEFGKLVAAHGMPHLVLVDLELADQALVLLTHIRDKHRGTRTLCLAHAPQRELLRRAFLARTCAALPFSVSNATLRQALDDVRERNFHHNDLSHHCLTARPDATPREANPLDRLSGRQKEILREMMKPERLSTKDIADALGISLYTVAQHRKAIYRKLQVHGARAAIAVARRWGFQ